MAVVDPFIVKLKHKLGPPATTVGMKLLRQMLRTSADKGLVQFYTRYNGATLYQQPGTHNAAIRFFPIEQWNRITRKHWKRRQEEDELAFERRMRRPAALVFGEIPHSANYLVLRTEGQYRGNVFYDNHEDRNNKPLAKNFDALLEMIYSDPVRFIRKMGGYTRYNDGATDIQWIPERFLDNVRRSMR